MREFEFYEMYKRRCPVCSYKNKVHTELFNRKGEFTGYSTKCCNCGNYEEFHLDYKNNGNIPSLEPYKSGKQRCIKPSPCSKHDCPLFGTCDNSGNSNPDTKPHYPMKTNCGHADWNSNTVTIVELSHKPKFL